MDFEREVKTMAKQIAALERTVEALAKEVRSAGDGSGTEKRVAALEKTVDGIKVLTKNHESLLKILSAGNNNKAESVAAAEFRKLEERARKHEDQFRQFQNSNGNAVGEAARLASEQEKKLIKQREALKASIDAASLAQTRAQMALQADLKKQIEEAQKLAKEASDASGKFAEKAMIETRFVKLESLVNAAMALAGRR